MPTFSEKLTSYRHKMGYSQDQMGNLLGVTGKYVGMIERGEKDVAEDSTLSKLLGLLEAEVGGALREDVTPYSAAFGQGLQEVIGAGLRARQRKVVSRVEEDTLAMLEAEDAAECERLASMAKAHIDHLLEQIKAAISRD